MLSDCGVRREELCIIKDADVNLMDMQVRVYAPKTRQTRWRIVPFSEETAEFYHWHIELMPKLTRVAGFEWGTGFYINPTSPEEAARVLRGVKL